MGGTTDRGTALRLLRGLEDGGMDAGDAYALAAALDPVLVHVVIRFLRASYPATHPAAQAVLERVVRLTSTYPAVVALSREGESDPVAAWFESEHGFAEFRGRGRDLINLIVDKLES